MVADGPIVLYRYFRLSNLIDPRSWSHLMTGLLRGVLEPLAFGVFGLLVIAGAWVLFGRIARGRPRC